MNKRNLKDLPPRQFPKQQYIKLTHKMGLVIILPIVVLLIGGGIGVTYYHYQQPVHHTYRVTHKHVNKTPAQRLNHPHHLKAINVKQGEHLLGYWLKQLHYPTEKAQSILTNYQKQNKNRDLTISQTLNQLTHSSLNRQTKIHHIRHLINKI